MTKINKKKLNIEKEYLEGRKAKAEALPKEQFEKWQDEYQKICDRLEEIYQQLEASIVRRVDRICEESAKLMEGRTAASIDTYLATNPGIRQETRDAYEGLHPLLESGSDEEFEQELSKYIELWRKVVHDANTPVQQALNIGEVIDGSGCPWQATV